MSWSLRRRLGATYAVTGVCLLALVAIVALALVRLDRAVIRNSDRLSPAGTDETRYLSALLDEETGLRGYTLTGQQRFLAPYVAGRAEAARLDAQLHSLLAAEPALLARFAAVEASAESWSRQYAAPAAARGLEARAAVQTDRGKELFDAIRSADSRFSVDLNSARTIARTAVTDDLHLLVATLAVSVLGVVLLLLLIARALRSWVTTPLRQVAGDARAIAAGQLDHEVEAVGPPDTAGLARDVESMRLQLVAELEGTRAARLRLQAQADELARSNRDLEQFAYVASHDLQEPLRKVASFCQLLERRYAGQLDERADTYIGFAVDGAKRMQQLINDLLAFSRVGRSTAGFAPVDLGEALERAKVSLAMALDEAGGTVTADRLPVVDGDRGLLVQLLQNLVGNGLKFRGVDPPVVRLSARHEEEGWQVTVRDNGIGVDPAYADKIFVIFQRLHNKEAYAGTGIGLALCRKIVEFHGGRLWLDTEADPPGATFRFTLPAPVSPATPASSSSLVTALEPA